MRKQTSISVDEELWRTFSVWVVERFGNRRLSDKLEEALKEYLETHKDD